MRGSNQLFEFIEGTATIEGGAVVVINLMLKGFFGFVERVEGFVAFAG